MFKPNKEIKYTADSLVNKKVQPPGLVSINKIRVAAGIIKVRWYWKDMLSSHTQDLSTIIYVTLKRYLHINAKFVTASEAVYARNFFSDCMSDSVLFFES